MNRIPYFLVDTGIENVHVRCLGTDGRVWCKRSYAHHGKLKSLLDVEMAFLTEQVQRDNADPEIYLTGGVFRWRFMRECAEDDLRARGIRDIRYDENEVIYCYLDCGDLHNGSACVKDME